MPVNKIRVNGIRENKIRRIEFCLTMPSAACRKLSIFALSSQIPDNK